jgi:hypothetical protein
MKAHRTIAASLRAAARSPRSYCFFPLGLASREARLFETLTVSGTACYDNFGDAAALEEDVADLLVSLGNRSGPAARAANVISRLTGNVVSALKADTGWVRAEL